MTATSRQLVSLNRVFIACIRLSIISLGAITCAPASTYAVANLTIYGSDKGESIQSRELMIPQCPFSVNAQRQTSTQTRSFGKADLIARMAGIAGLWAGESRDSSDFEDGTGKIKTLERPLDTRGDRWQIMFETAIRDTPGRLAISIPVSAIKMG
jgi:hypothetical protein